MISIPDDYEWLLPWAPISEMPGTDEIPHHGVAYGEIEGRPVKHSLEEELQREVSSDHVLHGCNAKVAAYCIPDPNEFLFLTDIPGKAIACVHMTWAEEDKPSWPRTETFETLDAWTIQMHKAHEGHARPLPASKKSKLWIASVFALAAIAILGVRVHWNQCQRCGVQEYERSILGIPIERLCEREYDEYGTYAEWREVRGKERCSHLFESIRDFSPATSLHELADKAEMQQVPDDTDEPGSR